MYANAIRKPVRKAVRASVSSLMLRLLSRYFRRNEGTTDYASIPEVVLSGDFDISFDALVRNETGHFMSVLAGRYRIIYQRSSNNIVVVNVNTSSIVRFDGLFPLNVFSNVSIRLRGSVLSLFVNGDEWPIQSGSPSSVWDGDMRIDNIYAAWTTGTSLGNMEGILANLKIWDDGVLVRHYPLDDGNDILCNEVAVLGANLAADTGVITSEEIGGDTYSFYPIAPVEEGKTYRATLLISNYLGSEAVGLRSMGGASEGFGNRTRSNDGSIDLVFTADSSFYLNLFSNTANQCTFSNISLMEVEGYGAVINGTDDDWGLFDRQATGEWLGQELITQSNWENPSSIGSQWSFADDLWSLESDGTLNSLAIVPAASNPDRMRIEGDIISINQNRLSVLQTGGLGVGQFDSVGPYFYEWDLSVNGKQEFKRANGAANVTISKPSLKEVLQVS